MIILRTFRMFGVGVWCLKKGEQKLIWWRTHTLPGQYCFEGQRVEQLILENRRVRIADIAVQLNISKDTTYAIVHYRLGFHKVSAR